MASLGRYDLNKFNSIFAFALLGSTFIAAPAFAGPATNALSTCVADNTTGKDRKDLAQWIFVAMTVHPDIQPYSQVSEDDRDGLDRKLAALATKLITEDCRAQAKAAIESDGSESFKVAFGALGQLAMQELMSDPSVNEAVGRYAKYLDKAKFEAAFSKK